MSAGVAETVAVKAARDDWNRTLTNKGHAMAWQLGPNARRRGHAYFWEATCTHCGAEISVADGATSCGGVRDARHVACSGPGTAVLTDIETARVADLITAAVTEFRTAIEVRMGCTHWSFYVLAGLATCLDCGHQWNV